MMWAALGGHLDAVRWLHERCGEVLDRVNLNGNDALCYAGMSGNIEVLTIDFRGGSYCHPPLLLIWSLMVADGR